MLLCEVSQAPLESGIEGIDTVSIIAFTGQDNGFLLIFRKSGHVLDVGLSTDFFEALEENDFQSVMSGIDFNYN